MVKKPSWSYLKLITKCVSVYLCWKRACVHIVYYLNIFALSDIMLWSQDTCYRIPVILFIYSTTYSVAPMLLFSSNASTNTITVSISEGDSYTTNLIPSTC